MKIAVCSDIHLEFGPIELKNTDNADVLVLSGDICVAKDLPTSDSKRGTIARDFFRMCALRFPHVIYVMGNHEHYNGDFAKSANIIKDELAQYANVHLLDKEIKVIDDVTFVGGTLWTDMNKEDGITLYHMKTMMNDFMCVNNGNRTTYYRDGDGNSHTRVARFTPDDAVEDHKKMLQYIDVVTDILGKNEKKYVVVGHHAPSKASTHPRYAKEQIMNGGYSSDLSEFILDRPQIKLWTHGHTHEDFDYMIGSTRIVCNPRGYIDYEDCADRFTLKTVEI
jgi:predicted phosphodiesterase